MKKVFANIIQYRGSHYDFGFMQGDLLKDSIMVKNREEQWKVRKPLFRIDIEETQQVYNRLAPFIWEEFLGLQDALKWPMERVLLEFGGYRVNIHPSGCSIYVGKDYLIRNYDYHPKTYDGLFTVFQPNDGGYAIMGPSQKVTGRMDGLNEKGLTMGYTFMNRKRPGEGFVCNMIGRLALELCATAEEAVDLLKEIPHRHSFSYTFFDKECCTPYIVETSPRRVEVRRAYSSTNHFHILTEENRHHLVDSLKRQEMMEKNQVHDLGADEAFQLLNRTDNGVFSKLYSSWAGTIHTSAYFPKDMKVWFALGGDQDPVRFDFSKWLNGKNLPIDQIEGEVDTDIPFVHMEKADWYRS